MPFQIRNPVTTGGYEGLATAILSQAVIDYFELESESRISKTEKGIHYSKHEITSFLRGEWAAFLLKGIGGHLTGTDLILSIRRSLADITPKASYVLRAYTPSGELAGEFSSLVEGAAFAHLKTTTNICDCVKGRAKSAGGYMWKYE